MVVAACRCYLINFFENGWWYPTEKYQGSFIKLLKEALFLKTLSSSHQTLILRRISIVCIEALHNISCSYQFYQAYKHCRSCHSTVLIWGKLLETKNSRKLQNIYIMWRGWHSRHFDFLVRAVRNLELRKVHKDKIVYYTECCYQKLVKIIASFSAEAVWKIFGIGICIFSYLS